MIKKEISNKKKRLQAIRAQQGEPDTLFNTEVVEETPQENEVVTETAESTEQEKTVVRKKKVSGKKLKNAQSLVDSKKEYTLEDGLQLLRKVSYASFVGTVELHLVLKEKGLQGVVSLPNGTGRTVKIVAIAHDEAHASQAREAGADHVGAKEITDQIQSNKLKPGKDFDVVVAHPQAMVFVTPLARLLGPKKMMPNPKNGTVGTNLAELIKEIKKGKLSYKAESVNPYIVHTIAGKIDFPMEKLVENIQEIVNSIGAQKIRKAYITSTMSPSITLKLS